MPVDLLDVDALIGRHPERDVGRGDVADRLAEMDRVGIGTSVVSHTASWLHDPATGNRRLLDAVSGNPRLLPCWVMLPDTCGEIEGADEFVRAADSYGVVAVRAYPHDHGYDLAGPDAAPLLDALAEARMPLLVDAAQADSRTVEAIAAARPSLPVVVCKPGYRTLRRLAGMLSRRPNVLLDTANLSTHRGLEWLSKRFGPGRLLFGTGTPEHDPGETVTRLLLSELGDADVAAIGRTNALGLLDARVTPR
ncbi:amidohydrolase family protein [Nonomuraea sp. NPDC046802]|uniref:amidohydrolase family protein n=1 Tax=Nonomuraea sp. NPDC046802 TaxID=3154919 RepID=UPI00340952C7